MRSTAGRSLRAVGQNQESAALIGIDVPVAFALAFGLAVILGLGAAGLASMLLPTAAQAAVR